MEVEATAQAVMDLRINDPEEYFAWEKRWMADRTISLIPVPRARGMEAQTTRGRNAKANDGLTQVDERLRTINLERCRDCDHFNNDVNTGAPLNPPCGLNRQLTICAWKRASAMGEKQGDGCLWRGETSNKG